MSMIYTAVIRVDGGTNAVIYMMLLNALIVTMIELMLDILTDQSIILYIG